MRPPRFLIGQRVVVYFPAMPEFCGPATVIEREYRVCINQMTGLPFTDHLYRTERMPPPIDGLDKSWWTESLLSPYQPPADSEFASALKAMIGVGSSCE